MPARYLQENPGDRMPTDFQCSLCHCYFSLGCYHGFGLEGWLTALYCQHCGAAYTLAQSAEQFFRISEERQQPREYELRGPISVRYITVWPEAPRVHIRCEQCGADGRFGPAGPITDRPPEG